MITVKQFYKVCNRLGFKVFKDYPYKDFYKIFYEDNKDEISFSMARLIAFQGCGNEVILFRPVRYSVLSPGTSSTDKIYSDINEFEKDLMENYFTFRKYWFEYNLKEHSVI